MVARQMREQDWENCPLGPPGQWPQELRSVISLMLGSAFPMFCAWGPALTMFYNDGYRDILGAQHPAALGQPFYEVWHEIRSELKPLVNRALGGESFFMEDLALRLLRRGFEEDFWVTFSYSPLLDADAKVVGIYCACTETTKSVLAARHQQHEQDRLKLLFNQAPGFAAVVNGPNHVFELANRAYLALAGFRDIIGKPVVEAFPEFVAQGFVALMGKVYATGEPFVGKSVRVMLNRGPGASFVQTYVDFVYQPVANASGQVDRIFIQGHDVTDQHRAEQALRDADRQKDEFLATLAHELRNPLAPIRSACHLLAAPNSNETVRLRAIHIIERQVGQMARLLDDLLDVARITQRRLALKPERLPIKTVVANAIEAARPLAEAKQHRLDATVADPDIQLMADPVRLAQVLANLLNNATKYTDRGGRITLDVRADGSWLAFTVQDNGIGMNQAALENVFTMFAQEKSALERSEGGLGIGLALAKGLVELHGGTVSAQSDGPGLGSRFVVRLPHVPMKLLDSLPRAKKSIPVLKAARALTVVVADDNRDAADMLAELLRLSGHVVQTANEGLRAVKMAERLHPDVLVLDIGMPGMNGYEVARHVRSQPWGVHALLIAATGWGQDEDQKNAMEAGFDAHLTKPIGPKQLTALLAKRASQTQDGELFMHTGHSDRPDAGLTDW